MIVVPIELRPYGLMSCSKIIGKLAIANANKSVGRIGEYYDYVWVYRYRPMDSDRIVALQGVLREHNRSSTITHLLAGVVNEACFREDPDGIYDQTVMTESEIAIADILLQKLGRIEGDV